MIKKEDIPKREDCIERRDPPELFSRRQAGAKIITLLAPDSSPLQSDGVHGPSVREQWARWRHPDVDGPGFDVLAFCFLTDTFRPLVEAYGETGYWFPTLNCNVEVKKAPLKGKEGWQWLFMRIEMSVLRHGRNDLDVVILDEEGEVVALGRQTALVVGAERNAKVTGAKM